MNREENPVGQRVLMQIHGTLKEITIIEWSPKGDFVKLKHENNSTCWIERDENYHYVMEILTPNIVKIVDEFTKGLKEEASDISSSPLDGIRHPVSPWDKHPHIVPEPGLNKYHPRNVNRTNSNDGTIIE